MSETDLEQLLAAKEIIVVCGPGGVGKTTVAASAGLIAAQHLGGRVLVLTVDPARRLATALGLEALGNEVTQIDPALLAVDGIDARGELWVAQLDTKRSWDDLVGRHAPDAATRNAILDNSLYENVTAKFVQSHDYIAMERLHELHGTGDYDLIIVDTPPSRSAVDFLDAPERMADFFSSRLLRWLTVPYRSRLFTAASRPFYSVADRILGQQFLREIADFFLLFQTMYPGFVERAGEVQRTLQDRRTSFVVVSTLDAASVNAAYCMCEQLSAEGCREGAPTRETPAAPPLWCERSGDPRCMPASTHGTSVSTLVPVAMSFGQPIRWNAPPRTGIRLDVRVDGDARAEHSRRVERPPR